jgi:hypothetical protein
VTVYTIFAELSFMSFAIWPSSAGGGWLMAGVPAWPLESCFGRLAVKMRQRPSSTKRWVYCMRSLPASQTPTCVDRSPNPSR